MDKIIIDNRSDLNISVATALVQNVLMEGKISNNGEQHCYHTRFTVGNSKYSVSTKLNDKSERFVVTNGK